MTLETLETAISEAKRFLKKADAAKRRFKTDEKWIRTGCGYLETAAAKRASMDLTRALAAMRKGGCRA